MSDSNLVDVTSYIESFQRLPLDKNKCIEWLVDRFTCSETRDNLIKYLSLPSVILKDTYLIESKKGVIFCFACYDERSRLRFVERIALVR